NGGRRWFHCADPRLESDCRPLGVLGPGSGSPRPNEIECSNRCWSAAVETLPAWRRQCCAGCLSRACQVPLTFCGDFAYAGAPQAVDLAVLLAADLRGSASALDLAIVSSATAADS